MICSVCLEKQWISSCWRAAASAFAFTYTLTKQRLVLSPCLCVITHIHREEARLGGGSVVREGDSSSQHSNITTMRASTFQTVTLQIIGKSVIQLLTNANSLY